NAARQQYPGTPSNAPGFKRILHRWDSCRTSDTPTCPLVLLADFGEVDEPRPPPCDDTRLRDLAVVDPGADGLDAALDGAGRVVDRAPHLVADDLHLGGLVGGGDHAGIAILVPRPLTAGAEPVGALAAVVDLADDAR